LKSWGGKSFHSFGKKLDVGLKTGHDVEVNISVALVSKGTLLLYVDNAREKVWQKLHHSTSLVLQGVDMK
jgi:hypothetical protein